MLKWLLSLWGSLRLRIGAIIFLHAVLAYTLLYLFTSAHQLPARRIYILPKADRVAAIVLAFERAPPSSYPDLMRAFDDERQGVRILAGFPTTQPAKHKLSMDKPFRDALQGRPFRVEAEPGVVERALAGRVAFSRHPIRVMVALTGGRTLSIERYATEPMARLIGYSSWLNILVLLIDLLVVFWLAAQSTVPVERLVRAIQRDDMSLLQRGGAREFVELGRAFIDMRARLQVMLEERTRIIAAVAHDFRTYLTRLELRSDFISDPYQRAAAARDLNEMRQLMDDALTFARPDSNDDEATVIDIDCALERIARDRRDLGQAITLFVPGAGCRGHVSRVAFDRMLANLLDNAQRYADGAVTIRRLEEGDTVLVCVEDRGPGVPEERLADLARPFLRLENSRARHTGGVGLGLSIVEALAHRFGGDFRLENGAGGGLRALLRLRRAVQGEP